MRRRRNERRARSCVPDASNVLANFLCRELAALAGFRALRHLDFHFLGVDKIVGGNAEAAGSNLLDFVGSSWIEAISVGIFAAFAGVAAPTKFVHGQRECAMRLRAERAERHRLSAKA